MAPQQCSCVHGWAGSSCDIREYMSALHDQFHWSTTISPSPSPPPAVCHPNCGNSGTCVGPNNCSCQVHNCPDVSNGLSQCESYTPQLVVNHCGELDQTVSGLESVFNGAAGLDIPPAFFQAKGFLQMLAFVETRDGCNWTSCDSGGI